MTIVNDDSSVVIKWSSKLIDIARGVIYDRHMFIVQATDDIFETMDILKWIIAYLQPLEWFIIGIFIWVEKFLLYLDIFWFIL